MNEDIKKILEEVLDSRSRISQETHTEDHIWIEEVGRPYVNELIEEKKIKKDRWEKIKTQVLGWGILAVLSSVGTAVYHFFFKHGGGS